MNRRLDDALLLGQALANSAADVPVPPNSVAVDKRTGDVLDMLTQMKRSLAVSAVDAPYMLWGLEVLQAFEQEQTED